MKHLLLALLFTPFFALAQSVDVKDIPTNTSDDESTVVEIRKGKKSEMEKESKKSPWDITDNTEEVEGEAKPLEKEARAAWKTACDTRKTELKSEHPDPKQSQVYSFNCGKANCASAGNGSGTTCTSTATYKLKTKVE